MHEVGIDTNALGRILDSEVETARAIGVLQRKNWRLVLSEVGCLECFAVRPERGQQRAANLRTLANSSQPFRISLAEPPGQTFRRELSGMRWNSTPAMAPQDESRLWSLGSTEPSEFEILHEAIVREGSKFLDKEGWAALDRDLGTRVRLAFPGSISSSDIRHAICSDDAGRWALENLGLDDSEITNVIERPMDHPTLSMIAGLAQLNAVAAGFKGRMPHDYHWLTSRYGDWADLTIAINSAYCLFIITDDRALSKRLSFLHEQGRCSLLGLNSSAFFSEPATAMDEISDTADIR